MEEICFTYSNPVEAPEIDERHTINEMKLVQCDSVDIDYVPTW